MLKNNDFTALEGFLFIALAISSLITIFDANISISLIWAILYGLMFGSFATTFVARVPRQIIQKKADPYCMSCKHELARRDLYTIFSYISSKGRCRFCGITIPRVIFYTELVVTILFVIIYLQYGFCLDYLLTAAYCFCSIIALFLWIDAKFVSYPLLMGVVVLSCIKAYYS